MKRNKLRALVTTGALAVSVMGGGLTSFAATYSGVSDGSVGFKANTLVIPPITPPIVPPTTTPATDFGLLYVPTEFNFEETAVPTTTLTTTTVIPLDPTIESVAGANPAIKHVAVGDVRGTRKDGWKLEAKMTADLTTGTKSLTGATITMSQSLNELTPQPSPTAWTQNLATAGVGVHTPDTVTSAVTLSTASVMIMSASAETALGNADGRGEGYWEGEFTNIDLNVPAGAMNAVTAGEKYTGTIDWTLTDAI